jgi:hypothetical protein
MKTTNFNWGDETIDSRDIIARHEELQDEYNSLVEAVEAAEEDLNEFINSNGTDDYQEHEQAAFKNLQELYDDAQEDLNEFNSSFDKDELDTLTEVISQGEDSPDWQYGEVLIHEDYFTEYTEELVNDCYEMPKEFTDGKWPWNHMNMDWASAADEAKQDYYTIEVNGETYLLRA